MTMLFDRQFEKGFQRRLAAARKEFTKQLAVMQRKFEKEAKDGTSRKRD